MFLRRMEVYEVLLYSWVSRTALFALEIVLAGITVDSEPLGSGKPSLFLRYFNIAISHEAIPKF